jgi:CheY-like chemotaxis protein
MFSFMLNFPIAEPEVVVPVQPPVVKPPLSGALRDYIRVLLVEDNVVNQKLAARLLEKLGCEVAIANDGRDAIEMFQEQLYDLVFMDCQMPNMDGFVATHEIRRLEKTGDRTPIIG